MTFFLRMERVFGKQKSVLLSQNGWVYLGIIAILQLVAEAASTAGQN